MWLFYIYWYIRKNYYYNAQNITRKSNFNYFLTIIIFEIKKLQVHKQCQLRITQRKIYFIVNHIFLFEFQILRVIFPFRTTAIIISEKHIGIFKALKVLYKKFLTEFKQWKTLSKPIGNRDRAYSLLLSTVWQWV